jgi:hypothetical protein
VDVDHARNSQIGFEFDLNRFKVKHQTTAVLERVGGSGNRVPSGAAW